jgi:uncharacterized membrane protein YphA (DoxX/SURF4 family)
MSLKIIVASPQGDDMGSWPGFGLLVQRLATGIALLHDGIEPFTETPMTATITAQAMGAVLAIFIMMGLWTPVLEL